MQNTLPRPSIDIWMQEAKQHPDASKVGMYLTHNGVVRATSRRQARRGEPNCPAVKGMQFSYDAAKVEAAIQATYQLAGIYYVKVWLNQGQLQVGDDIMYVLIGGDIRPRVVEGLQFLVEKIKTECVAETELY